MSESKHFKIISSNISPGQMIYDKLTDKTVVDIHSNNKAMDEIMVKTCFNLMHNKDFLHEVMEWLDL